MISIGYSAPARIALTACIYYKYCIDGMVRSKGTISKLGNFSLLETSILFALIIQIFQADNRSFDQFPLCQDSCHLLLN
uniref:Uncharacterized protein n=1 Tax=Candidatus Kentrum eta TaxID=2126337 RepID=A0A450UYM7_9GAMM|nr:MAG: hypothetical protein BECKH772A_GA0070896_101251 [Candidatus Kentron sp. H]